MPEVSALFSGMCLTTLSHLACLNPQVMLLSKISLQLYEVHFTCELRMSKFVVIPADSSSAAYLELVEQF